MTSIIVLLSLGILLMVSNAIASPSEDRIINLPGQNSSFGQYSGYLDGEPGVKFHYWLVESSNQPKTDPLVLWLNGGPGCSSLDGLLNELGPYLLNDDGESFRYNKYSWNTIANVLFLESPTCVGFSYNTSGVCQNGDISTSLNNYRALQSFFKKFPEYRENEFFITGESYGGIYVPTLSMRVIKGMQDYPINLKGYAIGNGLSSYSLNSDSLVFFGYYHGLFGTQLWASLVDNCCRGGIASISTCNFFNSPYPKCSSGIQKAMHMIYETGINMYNMYADCIPPASTGRYHLDMKNIFHRTNIKLNLDHINQLQSTNKLKLDPPCTSGVAMRKYLNRKDVRKALHIPAYVQSWDICSDDVNENYERDYSSMEKQHKELVKHVRALIYNGDVDLACNFLGDEWLTDNLGLQLISSRKPWYENKQVGGFVKEFVNLTYTTIRGSGHMVPQDKPGPSLKMISSFIFNKPL